MSTDITLDDSDGQQVTISANILKAEGSDFILDSPARRALAAAAAGHLREGDRHHGGVRRALVHDDHDGLTLNYHGDYPAGITLNGVASIIPIPKQGPLSNVVIKGGIEFEITGFKIIGTHDGLPVFGTHTESVNLQEIINSLTVEVNNLKSRLAVLEAKG